MTRRLTCLAACLAAAGCGGRGDLNPVVSETAHKEYQAKMQSLRDEAVASIDGDGSLTAAQKDAKKAALRKMWAQDVAEADREWRRGRPDTE